MKKILIALMIVSLALISLVGCSSSKDASQKTEEELRDQIRAELEAEAASQQSTESSQPERIELLPIYEMGEKYPINFDANAQEPDIFSLEISDYKIYLVVNSGQGIKVEYSDLIASQYRIIEYADKKGYVFVFASANPPFGPDLYGFYLYVHGQGVEKLGYVPIGNYKFEDIKEISNRGVKVGNTLYEIKQHSEIRPIPADKIPLEPIIYEIGEMYNINFTDWAHEPDIFSIEVIDYEFYLVVNHSSQGIKFEYLDSVLTANLYRVIEHADKEDYDYVFVFISANPPFGPDSFDFYLYVNGQGVEYLGSVPIGSYNFEDIKEVSNRGVKMGNTIYELKHSREFSQ
ncbi:DUF4148 domain-containing protein [Desulfuribacillus alkaliarsenatis]|uniref:Uncharacterized protein n=1 Tax=Desulfuribacillus alkaliarsenatis TaxID=766136 RepID=A0A1E5G1Z0_9FIRM|nr:DUF4148 domain-containing protein [Desulfuribacillus alkaliarsenatis]OEF96986.1 hypothetical protein BHF68_05115 [Desulfuribacillus alkaliarsenatis]